MLPENLGADLDSYISQQSAWIQTVAFFLQIPVSCSYSPLSDCSSNFIVTTHIEDLDCVSNSRLGPSPGLASEHLGCELVDSISGYLSVFLSLHLSASQII